MHDDDDDDEIYCGSGAILLGEDARSWDFLELFHGPLHFLDP